MRRRLYNDPMRTNPMRFVGAVERAQAEARLVYPDYDEMAALGVAAARKHAELGEKLRAASNMALAAYTLGRAIAGLPVPLSPAEVQAKQEAEARAKAEEREARAQAAREARERERAAAEEQARLAAIEASAKAMAEAQHIAANGPATSRFSVLDIEAPTPVQREQPEGPLP